MKKLLLMSGLALACGAAHAAPAPMKTADVTPLKNAIMANFDRLYVIHATMTNLNEVALGKLAMTHTKNPDVLMVAKMTMTEHAAAQRDLAAAAKASGYPIPNDPGVVNKAFAQKLATMRGASFDKMYIAAQVAGHETAITLTSHEIENGQNGRIKGYATNKLPGILGHTSMIYTVAGKVDAPGTELRPKAIKQAAMGVAMQKMDAMKGMKAAPKKMGKM